MTTAESRREAGDAELARVISKITQEGRAELLDDAWQLHNSVAKLKSRLDGTYNCSCSE